MFLHRLFGLMGKNAVPIFTRGIFHKKITPFYIYIINFPLQVLGLQPFEKIFCFPELSVSIGSHSPLMVG